MLRIEIQGVDAIVANFAEYPQATTRAIVRALNRGINSARTLMTREISGDTGLRSRDVRDALQLREATGSRLEASLAASLRRIPLIKFHATSSRRGGVRYRLPGGAGRIPNAFIARMSSGHEGVFTRVGRARLPIDQKHGPSLGRVFERFRQPALDRAVEVFESNFDHEMQFARSQGAGAD